MAPFPFVSGNSLQTFTFRDAKGNTSVFRFYVHVNGATADQLVADMVTFETAIVALTNAAEQAAHGPLTRYGPAQYGAHAVGGSYESVVDKAAMVYQDNSGQLHRFEIPAPKVAIFKPDKITVDQTNAAVIAFNALMTAAWANGETVQSRQGIPLANYMGGIWRGRKLRKRLNILVLTPDLTASEPAE